MTNQPDYGFLLKLDKWTKKDAALILSGHDPLQYKSVRFNQDELPEVLSDAYQLYRIFCSVNFTAKYGHENYPLDYIVECRKKDIALPEPLLISARQMFQQLQKFERIEQQMADQTTIDEPVGLRERHYLLKTIGVLASMLGKEKLKSSNGKLSISPNVEAILQYVSDHDLPTTGLGKSNLYKKISEGIAALEDHF